MYIFLQSELGVVELAGDRLGDHQHRRPSGRGGAFLGVGGGAAGRGRQHCVPLSLSRSVIHSGLIYTENKFSPDQTGGVIT